LDRYVETAAAGADSVQLDVKGGGLGRSGDGQGGERCEQQGLHGIFSLSDEYFVK
jgi:hypothetical protein